MLLKLVTAQRTQTLSLMSTRNLVIDDTKSVFILDTPIKNTKDGDSLPIFTVKRFIDESICPVHTLEHY